MIDPARAALLVGAELQQWREAGGIDAVLVMPGPGGAIRVHRR